MKEIEEVHLKADSSVARRVQELSLDQQVSLPAAERGLVL